MADVILRTHRAADAPPAGDVATERPAYELIELLFFAYRDFVREADTLLARYSFGRAHHRVLHFVSRNPGLKVAELLSILKITKQSLGRVLRDLVDQGFIEASEGQSDRRQRLLHATPKGERLALEVAGLQSRRISAALERAGPGARETTARFLAGMINQDELADVEKLIASCCPVADARS